MLPMHRTEGALLLVGDANFTGDPRRFSLFLLFYFSIAVEFVFSPGFGSNS